jgi:dCTP deaminase
MFPCATFKALATGRERRATAVVDYLKAWAEELHVDEPDKWQRLFGIKSGRSAEETRLEHLAETAVLRSLPALERIAVHLIPSSKAARLTKKFFDRVEHLAHALPPSCPGDGADRIAEILASAWAYEFVHGEERELRVFDRMTARQAAAGSEPMICTAVARRAKYEEYDKTCRLVLKAIELIPSTNAPIPRVRQARKREEKGAVLSAGHLRQRIASAVTSRRHLGVVPLDVEAIQAASLDVHLGNWFVYARRARLGMVQIQDPAQAQLLMTVGREETFVSKGQKFVIHPGDLVLGATLEFVALPLDLMAFVEGKSRLGRLGLFVATASQVAPGFHGVIVLELANAGTVPLELEPGMPIAQLVFQVMSERLPPGDAYQGRYSCQIRP